MVRVAVEHAGLGQGLHKGVDEAPRDGGSPTIMPRREGMTLSGRLLFMNGVAVSLASLGKSSWLDIWVWKGLLFVWESPEKFDFQSHKIWSNLFGVRS